MPKNRFNFGNDFVLNNSNIGIGTTNPTSALTVLGDIQSSGSVSATTFVGDGSGLINVVGSGSGIVILDDTSLVGTAGTIDFGPNLSVSPISAGVVTVTGSSSSQWVSTAAGIHTLSNVGIGTTNPQTKLQIGGVLGFGAGNNVRIGDNTTGANLTTGDENIFIGSGAGNSTTDGYTNGFFGFESGYRNTTGYDNNFIGRQAGYFNDTGFANQFIGRNAGYNNTNGHYNSFFGQGSGYNNTTGNYNNFLGTYAGKYNTTGNYNNFLGLYIGVSTTASYKVILGSGLYTDPFDSPDTTKDTQFAVGIKTDANPSKYWLVGNENFNVGIGTTNPTSKLTVGGDVKVSGVVTATSFVGDGSGLTGITASGSGVVIKDSGSTVGTAGTIDFGDNLTVSPVSAGVVTVTASGGTSSQWVTTASGIHTLSNVGVGTTNPSTKLQVGGVIGFNDTNVRIGNNTTGANLTSGTNNIFMGVGAGNSTTTGNYNNFFGFNAGIQNTNGTGNNFFGRFAGRNSTTANYNNFLGFSAGYYNTTGQYNNFFGDNAGGYNTTGSSNVFLGNYTGISTSASYKVLLGSGEGSGFNLFDAPDTTKDTQFAVGVRTDANPSKYWLVGNENFNVGIGTTNPQTKLEIGGVLGFGASRNVRIGDNTTGANITSGINNNFMGVGAGKSTANGQNNNFFGREAGRRNISGSGNNFFGYYAGSYNTTGNNNVFVGYNAGVYNTSGYNNAFFGPYSGHYNSTGNYNAAFGTQSGKNNNTGFYNIFFGSYSGISTSASRKVILGSGYNFSNLFDSPDTTKDTQFAVGVRTDANPSKYWLVGNENFNVGIGTTNPQYKLDVGGDINFTGTLNQNGSPFVGSKWTSGTGDDIYRLNGDVGIGTTNPQTKLEIGGILGFSGLSKNVRIGDNATGANITSGEQNIFVGSGAGNSTTTGNFNNFIGIEAGQFNTTGSDNNFFGFSGGYKNTTGNSNSFFGDSAGFYNTVGNNNTFFGAYAGVYNSTGNFNTLFGSYTGLSTSASNKVIIGRGYEWSPTGYFDAPDTTKDTQFAVGVRTDANPSKYWLVGNENFNVGIGTTNPTEKLTVGGNILINNSTIQGSVTSVGSTTSAIGIHSSLATATYRSVEYMIQATTGTRYQAVKLLSVHDGSTAYNTTYGDIFSNGSISTFDVDISGGNIRLVATASTSENVNYVVSFTANKI